MPKTKTPKRSAKKPSAKKPLAIKPPAKKQAGDADINALINTFQAIGDNNDPIFQLMDKHPIPMEVFGPDGTTVFVNKAGLEMVGCKDASLLIGKYNLLKDPVCMDQLGYREEFQRAFKGEIVVTTGFPAPIDDVLERGVIERKPWEAATMDLYVYPVFRGKKICFVVCLFFITRLYYGRPEVVKTKEYIDAHWQDEYDSKVFAKAVNMSVAQLYSHFKRHTGITPGEYHKMVKVDHIKEKLADKNLSIKEAFAACGEDSQSHMLRVFKEVTGMTPKQFREKT